MSYTESAFGNDTWPCALFTLDTSLEAEACLGLVPRVSGPPLISQQIYVQASLEKEAAGKRTTAGSENKGLRLARVGLDSGAGAQRVRRRAERTKVQSFCTEIGGGNRVTRLPPPGIFVAPQIKDLKNFNF